MVFLSLFSIPFIVIAISFFIFKKKVTWIEFLIQVLAQIIVVLASSYLMFQSSVSDTEVWSGSVTHKERNRVSCSHSYSCNCRQECSGSGNNRSCSQVCDTCYEHSYDIDWDVYSNIGTFNIRRVDRQGLREPKRWTKVKKDDPVVKTSTYTNYIKGAKNTLFRKQGLMNNFKNLPNYPNNIYDYYHLNRLVLDGEILVNKTKWNKKLMLINAEIGPLKQANLIIVLTDNPSLDYYYALEQKWLGGKKNDVVVVMSVKKDRSFNWVKTMTLSQSNIFQVNLESKLMELNKLDLNLLYEIKSQIQENFKRKPMKDFEYLKASIKPTLKQLIISLICGIIFAIIGIMIAVKNNERRY